MQIFNRIRQYQKYSVSRYPMRVLSIGILMACTSTANAADPFVDTTDASASCPSSAYLVQKGVARVYDVDLILGDYSLLSDDLFSDGSQGKLNAAGYSIHDHYLYAWSYPHKTLARIGNDLKVEPLPLTGAASSDGLPTTNYYIGDVATADGDFAHYVYKPGNGNGSQLGLWRVELSDSAAAAQYSMSQVAPFLTSNGSRKDLRIYDIAFHPTDGYAYAVDKYGLLWRIDVSDGSVLELAKMQQNVAFNVQGTFGASYFDESGALYFSRNNDGSIFKVDIGLSSDTGVRTYTPVLFAVGPASTNNDGARCAAAAVQLPEGEPERNERNIDFGDAPFQSAFADNGARHGILRDGNGEPTFHLGDQVDGELDSFVYPLSDDSIQVNEENGEFDRVDDEDGIQFATGLTAGSSNNVVIANVVNSAGVADPKISAWIDFDRSETFDLDEQVLVNQPVNAGPNFMTISIPSDAAGTTWARFRLSSSDMNAATAGVADGEVEDMQLTITEGESVSWYPSESGYTTIAYEDNWPFEGDYDMNDLVAYLRIGTYSLGGDATSVKVFGEIAAVGAAYHNGFAIRIPGVLNSDIESHTLTINNKSVDAGALLSGAAASDEAIFTITEDVWDYLTQGVEENDAIIQRIFGGTDPLNTSADVSNLAEDKVCEFYRTEADCGGDIDLTFELNIDFADGFAKPVQAPFDPFLFATPGYYHGELFYGYAGAADYGAPGRDYEIHLKNHAPTHLFQSAFMTSSFYQSYAGTVDASNPASDLYYLTGAGLPWAIEITNRWDYPREFQDLLLAYPAFQNFVETNGASSTNWFADSERDPLYIFTK
ncbi:MAG: LruC domain-containing protein [Pseudomonadota bacterium]